ncbi:MAG: peptidylprolyl isomerase, partial [Candidatus Competibacter denitrificans]
CKTDLGNPIMAPVKTGLFGMMLLLSINPPGWASDQEPRILLRSGTTAITEQDLQQELLVLSEAERLQALSNVDKLKAFLRELYLGKRLVAEAEKLGLENQPIVRAHLAAQRRWVLSDALRGHLEKQIEQPDFAALAREHYATHRDQFQLPEQFKVAHILKKIRCDCEREEQRRRIEQLLARLQAGEDFATLAKSESEDTATATKGGDLGDATKPEQLAAPFAEAMAKLAPGQLSGVVETEYGFHIIKLLERQSARSQSFEEVQQNLEQKLRMDYMKDRLHQQGQSYLPGADAQYDSSALETLIRRP